VERSPVREPFSQRRYAKESYEQGCESAESWFLPGAAEVAQDPATNQLWRNAMLAQEAARDEGCEGAVIVLSADGDPGATAAVAGLRPLLRAPEARLAHVLLEDLVDAASTEPTLTDWATRFRRRYLDLRLAAPPTQS
jgi:hypothetical protein